VGWDGYDKRRVREIEEAVVDLALRALGLSDCGPTQPSAKR
jgi:hypothetical protein